MFFALSKVFGFFSVPSNFLMLLGLAGLALLLTRFARAGRRLLVASVILMAAIGVLPVGKALTLPLENRFPQWNPAHGAPTGVIVLGGVINSEVSAARGQITLGEAAERMVAAVELARQYPSARIVFAGGNAMLISDGYAEADFAQLMFEKLGVPRDRLSFERESRNTEENAVFSKRLVAPKPGERWLLVTSAMHMPRAIGTFRQVGFPVEAYPVDYQTRGRGNVWAIPDSLMGGLAATDVAFHEWLGLFVYWITGRIPVLFPAP